MKGRLMEAGSFEGKKIIKKIEKEQEQYIKKKRRGSYFRIAVLAAVVGIFFFVQIKGNEHFEITYYTVESEKIENPVRIAVLSDLHDREFGEGNYELVGAIRREEVDLICMVGDMVNRDDTMEELDVVKNLCVQLAQIAPVYYCRGNHESSLQYNSESAINVDEALEGTGAVILRGETKEDRINGQAFLIAASSSSNVEKEKGKLEEGFFGSDGFKLFLCHYPQRFYEDFRDSDFDLAFAGHFHGGQVRLPFLGGLYVPAEGFFPAYSGGQYQLTHGTLIVSRGLGEEEETIPFPRINNRPELIIVELK